MRHASIQDAPAVRRLLQRCRDHDGRAALSEFKELRVPVANATRTLVAAGANGEIDVLAVAAWHPVDLGEDAGYWAAEIAIDPGRRSVSSYSAALEALAEELGSDPAFWAFDADQKGAATGLGFTEVRAIVQMQMALPTPPPAWPDGFAVRSFEPGDESLWLELNQRVFAHHPEAGAIDGADLALRMAQPWFEPAGLLILEADGKPVGYCWTKMHGSDVGEIYMVGLVRDHQGKGLGKPLTRAGLSHLATRGATSAILYAEAANVQAVSMYEGMGFAVVRRLALYEREPS